jgi:class 3 adenylate cyclase/tetratricopeptide (TPR) repeat protein
MDFYEVLEQVLVLLQRHGRLSYRALKLQFQLDDEYLDTLKEELIDVQKVAVDQDGRMLILSDDASASSKRDQAVPTLEVVTPLSGSQKQEPLSYTPQHLAEKILTSRSALEGERKQVTVMFADIKDSTELIRDLDPEAAQQLLDPAIHIMMEAAHRFEGTVNQVLGDGVMALFGAPIAHEDHAARACYAALAMQTAMQPYADDVRRMHGIEMRIRVGLNSGEVVVRTIGNDLHMDYSAVGPTVHLAARMEQMATPGSTRFTSSTLRLVEGMVRVNTLGPVPVKGITEPVEVYDLTGVSAIRLRLQAAVARGLTKFVGRDTEIEVLNQALEQAKAGSGHIVAAVGEAGLGKSRLFYEFTQSHRTQGCRVLESASVSYGKATSYFPVIDLLKRYAHVEEGDDARTIRAKLTGQVLTLDEALHEVTPAILALCDVLPDDHPFLQLDPPQRRQHTLDALKRLLLRESQEQPLLLVFEDLHWIDSETQALLDNLVASLPTARLLLLVNYRPEYQHTWGSKTFYTQLRLDPLPPASADAFLQSLLGDDPSLSPLKPLLIERTQGNPFFLEETVRTLVETDVLAGKASAYRLVRELPSIQVPDTVQAILAARIDRLPQEEKQLLQTAAVIGTEIPLPLLQAIAGLPEDMLYRGLTHLQAAEFVYETQLFPEHQYTFKHTLTHEVAYGSLLQERRRGLHGKILETLEELVDERRTEQVERLAHHALRGEVWEKALAYFRQSGTKAFARSAFREAVSCFEQALKALAHLPENRQTITEAVDLRFQLRSALLPLAAFPGIEVCLRHAVSLAETLQDNQRLARALAFLILNSLHLGNIQQALKAGQRAQELEQQIGDVMLQGRTVFMLSVLHHMLGDYPRALKLSRETVILLEGEARGESYDTASLVAANARAQAAWCLAELGDFDEALRLGDEALHLAQADNQLYSLVAASRGIGLVHLCRGDAVKASRFFEQAIKRARELQVTVWDFWYTSALSHAYALCGRQQDALRCLEVARGQKPGTAQNIAALGEVQLCEASVVIGHFNAAAIQAQNALVGARECGERGDEAWLLRLQGDIHRQNGRAEHTEAERSYQQALALANELGMRPLQAHCHRGLGTLYSQTDQSEQAHAELSTAVEMYRDMEMTFWLPETEVALAEAKGKI